MKEVIQKPNAGLAGILLEGNCVAVDNLDILIIDIPFVTGDVPRRAPITLLFLCLRLTLL